MTDRLSQPRIGINDFLVEAEKAFDDKVTVKIVGDQWYSIRLSGWRESAEGMEAELVLVRSTHGTQDIEQTLYEMLESWKERTAHDRRNISDKAS